VQRAIALEGEGAPFLALNGLLIWNLYNVGARGPEVLREAVYCVDRALALDPELAEGLVARALLEANTNTMDAALVLRLLRRAHQVAPEADSCMWLGVFLTQTGRPELALSYGNAALDLDPLSPIVSIAAALPLVSLGRAEEGLRQLTRAVEREPHGAVRFCLGALAATSGFFEQARHHISRCDKAEPGIWTSLAQTYLLSLDGDREGTKRAADDPRLVEYARRDDQACWYLAQALAHAGDHTGALTWLRRGAERSFVNARLIGEVDQMLAGLRGEPEFTQLLRRMEERATKILHDSGF
jgi:tetratricopeptide (TPR) repeat protein